MRYRIGQFLLIMGVLTLIIFAVTFLGGAAEYLLCGSALIILLLGITLVFRNRPIVPPVERFRSINKFRRKEP